jgi:undecaprenyl-diphosphatase
MRAVIACGLGVGALTLAVETSWRPLATLDKSINTHWYAFGREHDGWVEFWKVITDGGGTLFVLALWLVIGVVLIRRHRVRDALAITVAIAASQLVFRILRLAVDRPRPPAGFVHVDSPSFPSAHTMAASTGALLLGALLWPAAHTLFRRVLLLAVMIAWAVLVGVSRVFLSVHWPSDVLAGWLCAVALVVPAYALALRHLPASYARRPPTP